MPVLWAVDELGLEAEQVDVGGEFGGNDQPEYLAKNPNGLIPTLEDEDFVLWESDSIVRYLCSEYGEGSLCPASLRQRALAEQWMDWKLTTIMPMMTPIFWGLVRTPESERNMDGIARAVARGRKMWSLLDAHLADHDYVAGDTLTMGDLPLGPQVRRWYALVEDPPDLPHLEAWYERLKSRPGFNRHCMVPVT